MARETDSGTSRRRSGRKGERYCEDLSFAAKEAFKRLRTNMIMSFPQEDTSCRLVGITSAQPSDGKSTVAINLAYSIAELDKRVLLVDADMRRSSIHEKAGVNRTPGLSELLNNTDSISECLQKYTDKKGQFSFDIIPGGSAAQNPSELLNSSRMTSLLRKLVEAYDYVVIDLPPVGAVVDAVAVSSVLDGMLVVIRENTCPRGLLAECMSQLSYANVNIIGFVVNGALEGSGKKYQYGSYSKGYYGSYYDSYY
jgi:capsular exopolysaccharide synthesis family protein